MNIIFLLMKKNIMDKEKDLVRLLNILMGVIEANKGVASEKDMRVLDAEGLAIKFFSHVITTLYIYRGVNIPDLMIPIKNYPDPPSVDTLVRASFETFLVFYYIFIDSDDINEIDLKYQSWELAGLYQRQKFPATLEESIKRLENERRKIKELEQKINSNSIFQTYKEKQKNRYFSNLKKSHWHSKGWAEIAISAGFSELNSKIIYGFLCEHAHSGNLSITQVYQAKDFQIRRQLMEGTIGHLLICTANMIKYYCKFFEKSDQFYKKNYPEPNIVSLWVEVGSGKI